MRMGKGKWEGREPPWELTQPVVLWQELNQISGPVCQAGWCQVLGVVLGLASLYIRCI